MFVADMPNVPDQYKPMIVAEVRAEQSNSILLNSMPNVRLDPVVSAVPAELPAPPVLVAQRQQQDVVTFCRDMESISPGIDMRNSIALPHQNIFSPLSAEFFKKIGKPYAGTVDESLRYEIKLVEAPKHGKVRRIDNYNDWAYLPTINYEGTDRAIFWVESQGKRYKVVVNFLVAQIFDEGRQSQVCDSIDFGTSNRSNTIVPSRLGQGQTNISKPRQPAALAMTSRWY